MEIRPHSGYFMVDSRVGISVSADIEYRPINAIIGKTDISVSVAALVLI